MKDFKRYTPQHLRAPIARVTVALRRYVSDPTGTHKRTYVASEAVRNALQVLAGNGIETEPTTVAEVFEETLTHRIRNGWLSASSLDDAVARATLEWCRATSAERRAA